jgi:hypothetical protein
LVWILTTVYATHEGELHTLNQKFASSVSVEFFPQLLYAMPSRLTVTHI